MISFLATKWFDIFLWALGIFVSALAGLAIERLVLGRHSGRAGSMPGGLTIQQAINVRSYHLHLSKVNAPTPPPPVAPSKDGDSENEWTLMGGFTVALVLAAVAYFKFRGFILALPIAVMAFGAGMSISALLYLVRRGIIVGRSWTLAILWTVFLFSTGALNVYLLSNPVFHGGEYRDLLRAFDHGGVSEILAKYDLYGVIFAAFQLLGVIIFLVMACFLLAGLLFLWSSVNLAIGARGRRLWAFLRRVLATSPRDTVVIATILAVIAPLLCSGVIVNWMSIAAEK